MASATSPHPRGDQEHLDGPRTGTVAAVGNVQAHATIDPESSDRASSPRPPPFEYPADFHLCPDCTTAGPCKPLADMTTQDNRFHIYRWRDMRMFRKGEFISFP
jgi:hypothetical protein